MKKLLDLSYILLIVGMIASFIGAVGSYITEQITPKVVINKDTIIIKEREYNIPVKVSVYQAEIGQCDSTPNITANGSKITSESHYYWCAVSRDLMYNYVNFDDTLVLKANQFQIKLIVKDNMASRWSRTIDIVIPPGQKGLFEARGILNKFLYPKKGDIVKIIKIMK